MKFRAPLFCLFACVLVCMGWLPGLAASVQAATNLVENGEPRAQIVIDADGSRMTKLAAMELQYYVQKMTGARLPIVTEAGQPGSDLPLKIYVGSSAATRSLGVQTDDLKYGATRMVSGKDYLVLIGQDDDYVPPEPWGKKAHDDKALAQWDELTRDKTDAAWGFTSHRAYKGFWSPGDIVEILTNRYGQDNVKLWNPNEDPTSKNNVGYWLPDRSGSLNAVTDFLRMNGVRWYMPGDLGDVIPTTKTLALPDINKTYHPDFKMRGFFWYNYSGFSYDDTMWARRNYQNFSHEVLGPIGPAHGMTLVHSRKEMQEKHPEYYALNNGERDTTYRSTGRACFSSKGLLNEAIQYARFYYDHYNAPHVSMYPQDGYRQCGCDLCKGKSASELVWTFVNNVATELYKDYPDRLVTCGAYTSYAHPPESIKKFSPNVGIIITNLPKPSFTNDMAWKEYQDFLGSWTSRITPGNVIRSDNFRTSLGAQIRPHVITFPNMHPHAMAKDLKFLKGISMGDQPEQSQQKGEWVSMHFDHVTLYTQTQFSWNSQQDVDVMLNEYYEKFYGPAAGAMKTAFEYAENNHTRKSIYNSRQIDQNVRIKFLELLLEARKQVGDDIHGQRIDFILSGYETMDALQKELVEMVAKGSPRDKAPIIKAKRVSTIEEIKDVEAATPSYTLLDMDTRKPSEHKTTFKMFWVGKNTLVVKVHCQEPDMANLNISEQVWGADSVAFLIETPVHSYYQVEVNPNGDIFDADRQGRMDTRWDSLISLTPTKGEDFWEVVMTFPVAPAEHAFSDPFNNIAGNMPTEDEPWFVNIGRVRIRDNKKQAQLFTIVPRRTNFHQKDRFARLYVID